jgi:hypothetical protein
MKMVNFQKEMGQEYLETMLKKQEYLLMSGDIIYLQIDQKIMTQLFPGMTLLVKIMMSYFPMLETLIKESLNLLSLNTTLLYQILPLNNSMNKIKLSLKMSGIDTLKLSSKWKIIKSKTLLDLLWKSPQ